MPIYKKKGDKADCGNYSGISLFSVAGKVLATVMLNRLLSSVVDDVLPESQCGFRPDRSTIDMVFVARQLQEKCREQQHKDLFLAFVDLTKEFDTVNRDLVWGVLSSCGCPPKFLAILRSIHDGMSARVSIGGEESEPFNVNIGVKQGCVLVPALFNIFLVAVTLISREKIDRDDAVAIKYRLDGSLFNLRRLNATTKTSVCNILDLQYADDTAIAATSDEALQINLCAYASSYHRMGLKVNTRKTEVMCQLSSTNVPQPPPLTIEGSILNNVDCFTSLGSALSSNLDLGDEIQNRLRMASSAFGRLSKRAFPHHFN